MQRAIRILAVAGAAVLPFSLVACGGDDDAGGNTRQEIIDQMTEGDDGATPEQAGCMADGILAEFGEDRARELLEADDDADIEDVLSPEEQAQFAELGLGCVDARAMIVDSLTDSGFSADEAACVADSFDDAQLQEMMQAGMAGQDPDPQAMADAVMECGVTP